MIFGKIFLNGNIQNGDLENTKSQLNKISVNYSVSNNTIYFDESEIYKLPKDLHGHYLPIDDESGFSFYKIKEEDIK